MDTCATYDDVNLILRLYEMRREKRLREARAWFTKFFHANSVKEFQELCPTGSEENASFRMVVSYWEMVASFITAGVLQKTLFFQSGYEMLSVWTRIGELVPEYRETLKSPYIYENLEKVANDYIAWMETRAPGSYASFRDRIRGQGR